MILFRADGNSIIGTGHIMRCLSLADGFRTFGCETSFLTADKSLEKMIVERGYQCISLDTPFDQLENELPKLLAFLEENPVKLLILDSYFVTEQYMRAVSEVVPVAYIDDLDAFDYPVGTVINYNLYAKEIGYPPNKKCFLGPQYVPLRQEFQNIPMRKIRDSVRHVLISTGGADCAHVALNCVRYIYQNTQNNNIMYHFVLGALHEDVSEIERISKNLECIKIHKQVLDMCSLMLQCDLAVSAGGSTLFELCACGVPTVTYVLADNQIRSTAAFEQAGIMLHAGDVREDPLYVNRIFEKLSVLIENYSLRKQMAGQMQKIVDGRGAERLVCKLGQEYK